LNRLSIPSVVPGLAKLDESVMKNRQIGDNLLGIPLGSGGSVETNSPHSGPPVIGNLLNVSWEVSCWFVTQEATASLDTQQLDGEILGAITSLPSIAPNIFADVLKGFLGEVENIHEIEDREAKAAPKPVPMENSTK
jgi:hypothetical protein